MISRTKCVSLLFLGGLFLLSGCIELEERVFLRRDGSGIFTFTVDMGQMKEMMLSMGVNPDELGEDDPFLEVEEDFGEQAEELNALKGVSNARLELDREAYTVSVLFDFADVDALNRGVNEVFASEDDPDPTYHEYYRYSRGKFERTDYFEQADEMKKEMTENQEDTGMDASAMFADMEYRTVFEFEQPVQSVSNHHTAVSADKRTVTFQYFFFNPEHEGRNPQNVIRF